MSYRSRPIADKSVFRQPFGMETSENGCFIAFEIFDDAALNRLAAVVEEFRRQKNGRADPDDPRWISYFEPSDRVEFWWPDEAQLTRWNAFWFSTPLPERHSLRMPMPGWDFGSMVQVILEGEYDIVGVRKLNGGDARLEFRPHAYPYGGTEALRALVRSFGHKITGFDDGTGFTQGDPVAPRWNAEMEPPSPTASAGSPVRRSLWERLWRWWE